MPCDRVIFEVLAEDMIVARAVLAVERDADVVQHGAAIALVLDQLGRMQREQRVAALRFGEGEAVGILLDVHSELCPEDRGRSGSPCSG